LSSSISPVQNRGRDSLTYQFDTSSTTKAWSFLTAFVMS
jgi:hypothetical protein